ncbi:X-ray repair cross-complementing protein 5 [Clonorchis sinensis]|uniref:X-ray repair cross-complementing protein 5 n=1 Tax=Clonorchis sinensis TaxID=79923 RepID=A0A8T1MEL5_CLOSI|nr:X-ray repair cross-complementing protein 5 [Clonorchis sinensis]
MTAAVCIILDVGIHMATDVDQAVDCLKLLIQRKFFQGEKEEFAVVLCGTEATDNGLADEDGNFVHISLVRALAPLDWDLLEFFNSESLLSTNDADVVDALIVGVNHLVTQCKDRKGLSEKRILLISNLLGPADISQLTEVAHNLRIADVKLSLIGFSLPEGSAPPESERAVLSPNSHPGPSSSRTNGDPQFKVHPAQKAIGDLWSQLNGESYTFDEAIPALAYFETRAVTQRGWKVDFQIGDSLSLPVEGFTQVREARPPALTQLYAACPSTPIRAITTYCTQDENATELQSTQVIRGHRYGNTMVPFTAEDKAAVQPAGEKCLTLIGFTPASNVPINLHLGDSVLVFVANCPAENHPVAQGLAALAQALFELNGVALVRRVYNRVSAPRLGVLIPEVRGTQVALFYTDLAFADDVRTFQFPSLPLRTTPSKSHVKPDRHTPTDEQLKAMDEFVSSLILGKMSDEDDSDAECNERQDEANSGLALDVKPEQLPSPWIQRLFTCFRERGLNPTESLIPSTSNQSMDSWLVAQNLPGLEQLLARIAPVYENASGNDPVSSARRHLLDCLPTLSSVEKEQEGESGASAAKRRRLMAAELFGLQTNDSSLTVDNTQASNSFTGGGGLILNSALSQVSQLTDVGSVDPVGDFDKLLAQGDIRFASQRLESRIVQLVTDPYTGSILRPRAVSCLVAYRERAIRAATNNPTPDLRLAQDYNTFIRTWREDLDLRGYLQTNQPNGGAMDPRLSFWVETITQGFGLVSDDEVQGIGVSRMEADSFLSSSTKNEPPVDQSCGSPSAPPNPTTEVVTEQLLDELE